MILDWSRPETAEMPEAQNIEGVIDDGGRLVRDVFHLDTDRLRFKAYQRNEQGMFYLDSAIGGLAQREGVYRVLLRKPKE